MRTTSSLSLLCSLLVVVVVLCLREFTFCSHLRSLVSSKIGTGQMKRCVGGRRAIGGADLPPSVGFRVQSFTLKASSLSVNRQGFRCSGLIAHSPSTSAAIPLIEKTYAKGYHTSSPTCQQAQPEVDHRSRQHSPRTSQLLTDHFQSRKRP